MDPVVIVGASLGGLRTAQSLRRFGYRGPITVVGAEAHPPYNRPPLSKEVLRAGGHEDPWHDVALPMRADTADVTWMLASPAVSASMRDQTVQLERGTELRYSALVVATGMRPRRLPSPSGDLVGTMALRTLEDAIALRTALTPGKRIVIAGAGFIGCEVAAASIAAGCEVTLVGAGTVPLEHALGHELGAEVMRRHQAQGVSFVMQARAAHAIGQGTVSGVRLTDGTVLPSDLLVEAIGSEPNVEWLCGNDVRAEKGLHVDASLRLLNSSGEPWNNVFVVGELARFPNPIYGGRAFAVEHWQVVSETARRAGEVLAHQLQHGVDAQVTEQFAPVPYFWSDQYDMHITSYGLPNVADRVQQLEGDVADEAVFGYFEGSQLVAVSGIGMRPSVMRYRSLVANRWTGRLNDLLAG